MEVERQDQQHYTIVGRDPAEPARRTHSGDQSMSSGRVGTSSAADSASGLACARTLKNFGAGRSGALLLLLLLLFSIASLALRFIRGYVHRSVSARRRAARRRRARGGTTLAMAGIGHAATPACCDGPRGEWSAPAAAVRISSTSRGAPSRFSRSSVRIQYNSAICGVRTDATPEK